MSIPIYRLRMLDYLPWVAPAILAFLSMSLFFATMGRSSNFASIAVSVLMLIFAFVAFVVIFFRGDGLRRWAREMSRNIDAAAIPYDDARIVGPDGKQAATFSKGVMGIDRNANISLWQYLSANPDGAPVLSSFRVSAGKVEYAARFGCYPTLVLKDSSGSRVEIVLVNPRRFAFRYGGSEADARRAIRLLAI